MPMPEAQIPFVDTDDIADLVTAALTDDQHNGKTYEVTGPRKLTFGNAVAEISKATGRSISYRAITLEEYTESMKRAGLPVDYIWLFEYLFREVLGNPNNQVVSNDVERVLGRKAKDFSEFSADTAKTGVRDLSISQIT